jgi:hypothetical protein
MPTPTTIRAINLAVKASEASARSFDKFYQPLVELLRGMISRNEVIPDEVRNLNVTMAIAVEDAMEQEGR